MIQRRDLIRCLAFTPVLGAFSGVALSESFKPSSLPQNVLKKAIPASGELIPVIGMGSYQTFNVPMDSPQITNLTKVLQAFFASGGSFIDSSPMYGRSEEVLGTLIKQLKLTQPWFAASKVWTYGQQAGLAAIKESATRMGRETMDLMQVHNLRDYQVQLANLNELKAKAQLKYTGITTSRVSQYKEFEAVMKSHPMDFVQLNYNIKMREAEKRLLPLAQDKGLAVIVNMPYEKGRLFKLVKGKLLPEFAKEFDCYSWGQFFLKFIVSHPAVTCAIPATSKVNHMQDNMQALRGRLPSQQQRKQMIEYFESL
ncbi:aldo/keto reductase [Aliikangiella sp. IMCC44653]